MIVIKANQMPTAAKRKSFFCGKIEKNRNNRRYGSSYECLRRGIFVAAARKQSIQRRGFGAIRDDNVVFLTPMKNDPQAAFRRKVPIGSELAAPMQIAVRGESGQGVVNDYRGKQVLAV